MVKLGGNNKNSILCDRFIVRSARNGGYLFASWYN